MYKLFSDLGVNGKLWLAIKDYTLMLKHGYYIQALYFENSRLHMVQGRGEYLLLLCIKFT